MEICGVYGNPIKNLSSIYEEIYTAAGFIQWKNPCLEAGRDYIYIKFNDLNPLALKSYLSAVNINHLLLCRTNCFHHAKPFHIHCN